MLFDLRGRGRRSTVRVIYIGLAAIFLLGFVGLGVGGGFGSSGILSSLTNSGEGGGSTSFASEIKNDSKATQKQPSNPAAWAKLAKDYLHEAGSEAYVTTSGVETSKGKELLKQASQAWTSYIALNPPKPDLELVKLMSNSVYSEGGLNEPAKEVELLQLVVAAEPSSAHYYSALADYAYKAHNTRVGDLASEKAVAFAPAADRVRVKDELAELKNNPSGEKVVTTRTNGKTYTGKLNSKGEIRNAVEVPASTGTTSTTKK